MSLKIEAGKYYRTRNGQEARIYCTDGGGNTPVHGAINKFGQWNVNFWSVEGKNQFSPEIDLIVEIKPKTRFFGYLVDRKDSNDVEILLSSNEHLTLARFPDMDQDIEVTWK